ncbi:MAG: hypothetical protein QOF63_2703 [Thermoanaerobaculia bacterium]|jgi:hypothetical protein|nr:hypothetical protein [Thermoanaerobaculia bacterium]
MLARTPISRAALIDVATSIFFIVVIALEGTLCLIAASSG